MNGAPSLRLLLLVLACLAPAAAALERYTVKVLERKPQSRELFVQGLEIVDGSLYVGTGNYGESRLLRYRFRDGELLDEVRLQREYFGEGVTVLGEHIYQLTWQQRRMLVYRRDPLEPLRTLPLRGEGWGLANDGTHLIYSDGSHVLRYLQPDNAAEVRSIRVTENGAPVSRLNELEWIDGRIWANIWGSHRIVIIDPASGAVTGSIDLTGLLPPREYRAGTDVLNGIARDPANGDIWVTGKRWPWLYRIELVRRQPPG